MTPSAEVMSVDEVVSIDWIRQADEGELRACCFHLRGEYFSALQRAEKAEARAGRAETLMQEFCDRVDRGEVRSVKTYAKFKAALSVPRE